MKPATVDYWREYFRAAGSDIFEVIEHAIMVAASDSPKEFRQRRDRIAERLFSCRLAQCSGCNRVELAVPPEDGEEVVAGGKTGGDGCGGEEEEEDDDEEIDILGDFDEEEGGGSNKESKVNSSNDNGDQLVSNYSYGEAEALTDEIEEQSQVFAEVLRIKTLLLNHRDEAESTVFDSLRRLQLLALSVDTLKATEIGKAVNSLRKHGSKEIRQLARTLIDLWKDLVDEWYSASKTTTGTGAVRNEGGTPDSMNPSVVDEEEGLPSPPMDEGIFFATQATGIELSQFFDGMDDDGNPRELNRNRGNGRRPVSNDPRTMPKPRPTSNGLKSQEAAATLKQNKPLSNNSGPGRPPKQNLEPKLNNNNSSTLQRRTDKIVTTQRKPLSGQQQQQQTRLKCSDEASVQMKLEATKRKLQESYQQVENAKKQRTIQVMEIRDLPKQGGMTANRNPNNMKHGGNGNRHWTNGRR